MAVDRPNQLDDLWIDWGKKTLEQKQALLKKAVVRMPKVLFSRQDANNLNRKALEVAKALNLGRNTELMVTPSRKWLEAHDPDYARAKQAHIRAERFGELFPPELDPWSSKTRQEEGRVRTLIERKIR